MKQNKKNLHLLQQSLFLEFFLYYHLKADFGLRQKIDSLTIEMSNPFTRHLIRQTNMHDPAIKSKYVDGMKLADWCLHLLENFYPSISGIWADYTDSAHMHILGIVRMTFECGFFGLKEAGTILRMLNRVSKNLLKLEEGWIDRLSKIKKLTNTFQSNTINFQLQKCKEHIACIVIQILTLSQDQYLINKIAEL